MGVRVIYSDDSRREYGYGQNWVWKDASTLLHVYNEHGQPVATLQTEAAHPLLVVAVEKY